MEDLNVFYCTWCKKETCRDCILFDRRHSLPPCRYEPVKDAAKACRENLRGLVLSLNDKKEATQEIKKEVKRIESTVKEARSQYVTEISNFYDKLIHVLKKRKEKAINQLKTGNESLLKEIGALMKETQEYLSQIEHMEERIESLSDRDILSQSEVLKENFKEMELRVIPMTTTKVAVPDIQPILDKLATELPSYSMVERDLCHVTKMKQFEVNRPAHMYITLRDSAGFPCSIKQTVSVSIVSSTDGTGNKLTVEAHPLSSSRYSVTLIPRVNTRGHGNIVVKVNEDILSNIDVFVECPPEELHLLSPQIIDNVMYWGCLKVSGKQVFCNTRLPDGKPIIAQIEGKTLTQKYILKIPRECKLSQWAPDEIAINDDILYVGDSLNNMLHHFSLGDGSYIAGTGKKGSELGEFDRINGLCVAADSLIYVCDTNNHRIQVFDKDLRCLREFGEAGTEPGSLFGPNNIVSVYEGAKVILYVSEIYNHRIQCLSSSGEHIRFIGGPGEWESQLSRPNILHIHRSHIYITDDRGVAVFTLEGQFVTRFATDLCKIEGSAIEGLTVTNDGLIYVYHNQKSKIYLF